MKKLGLLIVGAYALVACDATPGGNKSILPVEHDEIMEHVDHHAEGHDAHEGHGEEAHTTESTDAAHATEHANTEATSTTDADASTEKPATEEPKEAGH